MVDKADMRGEDANDIGETPAERLYNDISAFSLADLIEGLIRAMDNLRNAQEIVETWEYAIITAMEDAGATVAVSSEHEAKIRRTPTVHKTKLAPILELDIIDTEELIEAGAYKPGGKAKVWHEWTESWNMTHLKPFAERGAAVRAIIEAATTYGAPRLSIKPRKQAKS